MTNLFLGQGWSSPLRVSPSGGMAMAAGPAAVEQSVRLILDTEPGERPMRPEFGCAVRDYVFDSFDSSSGAALVQEVRRALERWEPRIVVDDVRVVRTADHQEAVNIHVAYRLSGTNNPHNLIHPFHLIPTRNTPGQQTEPQRRDSDVSA
ncbi:GPW/gp25 family protein [Streptomyces erythrochromogenes]|uniref:GPW/gp25 family protein n=1 Tax=Streptomyces erythrochromogenes TaxID=285574 RepID=UPI0036A15560